jgi:hypothetical protein
VSAIFLLGAQLIARAPGRIATQRSHATRHRR